MDPLNLLINDSRTLEERYWHMVKKGAAYEERLQVPCCSWVCAADRNQRQLWPSPVFEG